jgi:hypothetical protein
VIVALACGGGGFSGAAQGQKSQVPGGPGRLRSVDEIKAELAKILAAPKTQTDGAAAEREEALRRLMAYRYLAGVPYKNMVLDEALNQSAFAAALVCDKLGRLDHDPPNPGLPADVYEAGRQGARSSNLHFNSRRGARLASAVDDFMYDSDPGNIARVGHRRWCLNPALRKVGFGRSGSYFAMRVFDLSQPAVPPFDFIAYPAPGPMPLEFFRPGQAWSLTLNPAKYAVPADTVQVRVYPAKTPGEATGSPLALDNVHVDRTRSGMIPNCIIFRPEKEAVAAGKSYVVEIKGLRMASGLPAPPLRYPVEFVRLGNDAEVRPPDPGQLPKVKGYASIWNQTGAAIDLAWPGTPRFTLRAGGTLNFNRSLPPAGITVRLLSPDPQEKATPLLVHNGDRRAVRRENNRYQIEKFAAEPPAK